MKTLIVGQGEVRKLLGMGECLELMVKALQTVATGDALQPLRSAMWLPSKRGVLGLMPSYLANLAVMGVKAISVFPANQGTPYDSHQGVVLLYEVEHGRLVAVADATEITAIRTAAVSGVATDRLACPDAGDLAILGSGVQARSHLQAMLMVRTIRRVRVWSRNSEHCRVFAERESTRHHLSIESMDSAQEAVAGAEIICTLTAAKEPVLLGSWVSPGAHINAVGSCTPSARELDGNAVARAELFVDRRESILNESGDFLLAREEGAVGEDHIQAELGDVLVGRHKGRSSPSQITLFKSLGLAVEDLACAHHIYHGALKANAGTAVELGGGRYETD